MNTNELNTNVSTSENELSNTTVQPTDQDAMMQQIEDTFTRIRRGQIVPGEILYVTDNQIMVNINFRSDGIINRDEMPEDIEDPREHFKAGDQIDVYVVKVDDGEGNVVLSLRRIKDVKAWDDLEAKFESKEHLNVLIKEEVNKGLVADYEGARLFMPASHAYDRFRKNLSGLVGQTVEVELIDFDKSRRRAIISRREIERERIQKEKEEFWSQIEVGQVRTGKVARLTNFGAFIELGPVDGLIHISDMSWGRIRSPKELLNVGDEVEVKVLDIDQEKERVSLGIKQLKEDPWVTFTSEYKVGDTIKGTVVSMPDFGAFVNVGDGIDGLVHISQICVEHIEKPSDVLNIGQEVEAKIVDIKDEDKKVSLSMRALVEPEKPQRERRPRKERVKEEAPKEEKVETNPIDNPLFDSEVLGELKKMAQAESDDTEE
ncbi:30S ribosomal protein S1 [uncultured Ezakiella sp.]|uniref:30S ribosomal protein S1 n=1 Tax=uncultured Ezakiella sp. TaxID=1637529 RepID=UPI0025F05480|nr:30S ribosomal protein S1 [uncultured Ezakiella sp.]